MGGEPAYRKAVLNNGDKAEFDAAFDILREAVSLSENLKYDEPWGWMVPVRHALGALLFEQGRVAEAEAVYREDIHLWKDNMWGLLGVKKCLETKKARRASVADYPQIAEAFESASRRCDIELTATCFCAQEAGAACCAP